LKKKKKRWLQDYIKAKEEEDKRNRKFMEDQQRKILTLENMVRQTRGNVPVLISSQAVSSTKQGQIQQKPQTSSTSASALPVVSQSVPVDQSVLSTTTNGTEWSLTKETEAEAEAVAAMSRKVGELLDKAMAEADRKETNPSNTDTSQLHDPTTSDTVNQGLPNDNTSTHSAHNNESDAGTPDNTNKVEDKNSTPDDTSERVGQAGENVDSSESSSSVADDKEKEQEQDSGKVSNSDTKTQKKTNKDEILEEFFCLTTAAVLKKLEEEGFLRESRKDFSAIGMYESALREHVPFHKWNEWIDLK